MAYECKTCQEIIRGETFYFLWTGRGYRVFHWDSDKRLLDLICPNFFINIENARKHAIAYARTESVTERLRIKINALQAELEDLNRL